jgi:hypothetical protein
VGGSFRRATARPAICFDEHTIDIMGDKPKSARVHSYHENRDWTCVQGGALIFTLTCECACLLVCLHCECEVLYLDKPSVFCVWVGRGDRDIGTSVLDC